MKAENWRAAPYDYLDFVKHSCKQPLLNLEMHILTY